MSDSWSDRTVVVTGGRGFLGRAVCSRLRQRGVERLVTPGSTDYDLRRSDDVARLFADHGCRGGIVRLDGKNFGSRANELNVSRHPCTQATTANGNKYRIYVGGMLAQQLHRHRSLAGDHIWVIVGRDINHAFFGHQVFGIGRSLIVGIALQHHFGAVTTHPVHLD